MSPFGALLSLRRRCYESGWLRSWPAPVPAISIGNLTWGGTGKTPFTIWLAQRFAESGKRVGIVSRGYGRRSRGLRVVSDGRALRVGVEEAGDEPTLLARRLPRAIVVVSERRVEGARKAAELGAELLLLDDAFQHLAIRRDLDIVLLDHMDPLGGGLPPFGRSREPASALSRADLFVLTGADSEAGRGAEALLRRLNARAPIFHSRTRFSGWLDEQGEPVSGEEAVGAASIAVASIAFPLRFLRTLREAGAAPAAFLPFRDHHFYSGSDLRRIEAAARDAGASLLLTTEKDLVKLAGRSRLRAVAARVEPDVPRARLVRPRARDPFGTWICRLSTGPRARQSGERWACFPCSPSESARAVGRFAARFYFRIGKNRREIALRNLALAFPDWNAERIESTALRCAENFGTVLFDFLAATRLSREGLLSAVEMTGADHYRASVERGKGVFLLSAHFGNWEIGALAAGLLVRPIASVVRPLDNPYLEAELEALRGKFSNRTIAKKRAAREILRETRAGETVAILIDQNVLAREAVFVPFFGRPAATTPALALFQLKTDAAVVPVFCRPMGEGRYRLGFEKPIVLADLPEQGRSIESLTALYTSVTERVVRAEPHLWLWMHNRWRTRPPEDGA